MWFSMLLLIMLLSNTIRNKKNLENLLFPILRMQLRFCYVFLLKVNSVLFYVWIPQMDLNGKNCVFSVWFFHPKSLSSVKWEKYRTVQPEVSKTINKLLFSGTAAVSCFSSPNYTDHISTLQPAPHLGSIRYMQLSTAIKWGTILITQNVS